MKAVTKIYLLMIGLIVIISSIFILMFLKNKNEEDLLKEKGIVAKGWVTNLIYSKKSTPLYYMEVAFFSDSTKSLPNTNSSSSIGNNSVDAILDKMKIETQPIGDCITSKIEIGQSIYQSYKVNDKIKVIYLKEDPRIIRLIGKEKQ